MEDAQEVAGRPERETTDVIETEVVRDQSRVMSGVTGNESGEPVGTGDQLGHPPGGPHRSRSLLLPALAVTRSVRLS